MFHPASVRDLLPSCGNSFSFFNRFNGGFFFPNESVLLMSCFSQHFSDPPEEPPSVQSVWQRRSWAWLTSILNVRGCFTLAFQIPFAFFNPSLGPCLKQHRFREALEWPELYCCTAGGIIFYSCASIAFYAVCVGGKPGWAALCL